MVFPTGVAPPGPRRGTACAWRTRDCDADRNSNDPGAPPIDKSRAAKGFRRGRKYNAGAVNIVASETPAEPLRCGVCGCSSSWHAAFAPVKTRGASLMCCPKCAPRRLAKQRNAGYGLLALAGVLAAANLALGERHGFDLAMLGWAMFVGFNLLLVPLHEMGHVLAARLVGARTYAVIIGCEPWILDRELAGMRWRFGKTVGGGLTYHTPCEGAFRRLRTLVILSGGVAANLLIAFGAAALGAWLAQGRHPSILVFVLYVLAATSAFQFVRNLWPHTIESSVGKVRTDGARILQLLRGAPLERRFARATMHYMLAMFAFHDRNFPRAATEAELARQFLDALDVRDAATVTVMHAATTVMRAAARAESDDAAGAVALLQPMLGAAEMDLGVRSSVEDNLAWAYFLLDEPELLERALALLKSAREIAPWQSNSLVAEACVLAASSAAANPRVERARELLRSLAGEKLDRQCSAYATLASGLCAAAEGDRDAAIRQRDRAKSLGATAAPLRLLERRIPSP